MKILFSIFTACLFITPIAAERPNIVLVMCDDLGYGDVGCFNSATPIQTPHLDQMAANGLKFNRFYAAAPVCSPTRGSCLTGRHPYRYGIYFANVGHIKKQEITLPELLRPLGYETGHFGKWHLGTLTLTEKDANRGGPKNTKHFAPPSAHGYTESFVTESKVPTYDPMIKPEGAGKTAWDPLKDRSSGVIYGTRYWDHDGNPVTENLEGDDSRIIMDRALPFIEESVANGNPFFAAIRFHAPHLPVVAGKEHTAAYQNEGVYERNYYGCVTALDEQVGRLRSKLRELAVADNTMVWFCSDNGPEGQTGKAPGSAGPLRGRKRSLYEGGVRVPAILEWPDQVKQATETEAAAVTSDYLPTVLEILSLDYPSSRPLDGASLVNVIKNPSAKRLKPIGFQSKNQVAWHDGAYKLFSKNAGKTWELFELDSDPGESNDLAATDPARVERMAEAAKAWLDSCKSSDAGKDYE
ncbi:MAG: sulfatase-like hydrolase/transferase [Planctomycetota bacterium]